MAEKTVEPVPVEYDELSLSLLGWQVMDLRARLATETYRDGSASQKVTVAGTVRFLPEDWTARFRDGDYAPYLLVSLHRRGSAAPAGYERAVIEEAEKASRRPIRFTETSDMWLSDKPLKPEDLEIRLICYDLEEIDRDFALAGPKVTALPITVIDESSWPSLRLKPQATACILHDKYGDKLRVGAEGVVEFGTVEELFVDRIAHRNWNKEAILASEVPFKVKSPDLVIEILDDEEFLLEKHDAEFFGEIAVNERGHLPARQPRWVATVDDHLESLAGTPAKVIVRIRDAGDL